MVKNIKFFIQIILFFGVIFSSELEIGEKMPGNDHLLLGLNGKNITLSDIKGTKGTLVIFLAFSVMLYFPLLVGVTPG